MAEQLNKTVELPFSRYEPLFDRSQVKRKLGKLLAQSAPLTDTNCFEAVADTTEALGHIEETTGRPKETHVINYQGKLGDGQDIQMLFGDSHDEEEPSACFVTIRRLDPLDEGGESKIKEETMCELVANRQGGYDGMMRTLGTEPAPMTEHQRHALLQRLRTLL